MEDVSTLTLDAGLIAVAIPAVLFAGISKGGFGSGAAFASTLILALVLAPGTALGLMLPLLMLIDLATLRPYWRQWSWPDVRRLVLGGLPGVALGAALYRAADADLLRLLIGTIALVFVAWRLALAGGLLRTRARAFAPWVGVGTGAVAGFTSFVSHSGGPPVAMYLLSQGLGKTAYQATSVLTFWAINIFKAVPYGVLGIFTAETLLADLLLAPFALLGAWAGVRAHHRIPERVSVAIAYTLLTATGSKLIWDALT